MRFLFIFSFLIFPGSQAADISVCQNLTPKTWEACSNALLSHPSWSPLKENIKAAKEKSNGLISMMFDPNLQKIGLAKLEIKGGKVMPVIVFGSNEDFKELLITFNHELVHYNHLFMKLPLANDNKKLKNCLTSYRLELLKDETFAFQSEIQFWKNAPASFRESLKGKFPSRLLSKTLSYDEYYQMLEEKLKADSKFIERRYIEMGEYPACALELI